MSLFADLIEQGRMFADVHLGSLTTYKLGGPARLYFEVRSEDDLGLHDAQGIHHRFERARHAGGHLRFIHALEQHDNAEHHGGGADDRRADEHGLGGGLEGVAGAVVLLEELLGLLEVHVEAEVPLDLLLDALDGLDGCSED